MPTQAYRSEQLCHNSMPAGTGGVNYSQATNQTGAALADDYGLYHDTVCTV